MKPFRYGLHRIDCELRTRAEWPPLGPWFAWLMMNVLIVMVFVSAVDSRTVWLAGVAIGALFVVNELFVPIVWRAFRAATRRSRLTLDRDQLRIQTWARVRNWPVDPSVECSAHPGGLLLSCSTDSIYLSATAHELDELEALAEAICRAAQASEEAEVPDPPEELQEISLRPVMGDRKARLRE